MPRFTHGISIKGNRNSVSVTIVNISDSKSAPGFIGIPVAGAHHAAPEDDAIFMHGIKISGTDNKVEVSLHKDETPCGGTPIMPAPALPPPPEFPGGAPGGAGPRGPPDDRPGRGGRGGGGARGGRGGGARGRGGHGGRGGGARGGLYGRGRGRGGGHGRGRGVIADLEAAAAALSAEIPGSDSESTLTWSPGDRDDFDPRPSGIYAHDDNEVQEPAPRRRRMDGPP
jgi:hypothetical protein